MSILPISRNDVLQINGGRYEVLEKSGGIFTDNENKIQINLELSKIGENPHKPRFFLTFEPMQEESFLLWERDIQSGFINQHHVTNLELLEI